MQRALIRSHAAGMGPPVEAEVVRAMMLLRARTLAMGFSGARPVLVETILALLEAGLSPVVPEHGSLGASGDLAPLAHCALALIGEGEVTDRDGAPLAAAEAMLDAGIEPVTLRAKEGLALINGTDGILGMLVLALADLRALLRAAEVAAAMSVEALLGTDRAFAEDLIALRPQPGQADSAANLRALLAGSEIVASHREGDPRVQDAYSLRCAPQVAGAARDALAHAEGVAGAELGAAIDNPMILPDGRVESCGNFHGAPLAPRLRLPGDRRRRRRRDRRAAHRPPARRQPLPRPAAVPGRGRRSQLGDDDRPVHAGRDGRREPAAGGAGERRLAADQRDAGGPCLDGLGRGAEDACRGRQPGPGGRGGGGLRGARPRPAGSAAARRRAPRRRWPRCAPRCRGPGPDRWLGPELAAVEALVAGGGLLAAVEAEIGELR